MAAKVAQIAAKRFGVVFLGAPGVGKSTFANMIGPMFGLTVASTGDLVRYEIKNKTELGKRFKEISEHGKLVDDETIIQMARSRVANPDCCTKGFIFDGFPATVHQADTLHEFAGLNVVINFNLPLEMLVEKTTSRRVCEYCGDCYNLANIQCGEYSMPSLQPKEHGLCDKHYIIKTQCCGHLMQRADDTTEIVSQRLEVYNNQTAPLIDYYTKKNLLINFDIKKGLGDLPRVIELFKGLTFASKL